MVSKNQKKQKKQTSRGSSFGPVSRINTAPVAVGNSVRGTRPIIQTTRDGTRVCGRDFAYALSATAAAITDWELIGGMPVTPCALPSSVLRTYCQTYAHYKLNSLTIHYITSSPTSQAGDVMFYYEPSRTAPMVDYTNSSFLPYVLSDPNTIIGPQWTNHSETVNCTRDWKSTLYGGGEDVDEDAVGTLFMFSKTNAANSPGYILIDYDMTFKTLALNPRAGTYPIARAQSTFVCLTSGTVTVADSRLTFTLATGKTIANSTSVAPNGFQLGDVYKLICQPTASALVNVANSATGYTFAISNTTFFQNADDSDLTVIDGTTFYALAINTTTVALFQTYEQAKLNTGTIEAQQSGTSVVYNLCAEMQFFTNIDNAFTQSSY